MSHPHHPWTRLARELAELEATDQRRQLRPVVAPAGRTTVIDGRTCVVFSANNYLDLAGHPAVAAALRRGLDQWGYGAGASRLISGHTAAHAALEARLATWLGHEAALVFPSGYAANAAVLGTLPGKHDAVFIDKLVHASIIDGARASAARVRVWPHRNLPRLRTLLDRGGYQQAFIVTDSVFSMDGDVANLAELAELKRRYGAVLVVDEAHACGCLGPDGRGAAAAAGVLEPVDIFIVTFSKALGGFGGAVVGSRVAVDYLVNRSRGFIYTTALPPAACLAVEAALDIAIREPQRRGQLLDNATYLRRYLTARGYDIGASTTHIVPIILGDSGRTVAAARRLESQGYLVPAVRPPTVAPGSARLRVSVSSAHTRADLDGLLTALATGAVS